MVWFRVGLPHLILLFCCATMTDHTSIDDIRAAASRIAGHARVTPCERSYALSEITGADVWLKYDSLQVTGSFKFRGALNTLLQLSDDQKARGIITASSGNHGMAVSRAAEIAGVQADIYLSRSVSPAKLSAITAMGGNPVFVESDDSYLAEATAATAARETGKPYISPYNDHRIIAGQGTCGLEIAEQVPSADAVFVAVGGGGLISGIGLALEACSPGTKLVGCWPEASPTLKVSIDAGEIIDAKIMPTLSDGTAGGVEPDTITFDLAKRLISSTALVTEKRIAESMRLIAEHERHIIEGAAGVALGALLDQQDTWAGKTVVVLLCGRNVTFEKWAAAVGL
jgi:threonine dehydratase